MLLHLIVIETLFVVTGQLLLRQGAMGLKTEAMGTSVLLEMVRNPWIWGGLVMHGLSFVLYVFILSKLRLNIFYPIATGASLLLISVLSVVILKEKINATQVVGLVIIMFGMSLVYLQKS